METTTTQTAALPLLCDDWSDPLEDGIRSRVRDFIEAILEEELEAALGRKRYERGGGGESAGHRNGHRSREVIGTFGSETIMVPRARLTKEDDGSQEWRSKALRRYQRLTKKAEALIASVYLAGTNTRRVRRALSALFAGAVGKDVVSRAWRKVKTDWEAWNARDLGDEDIVRLILDGTVVKARLDKKATNISVLVALGVRRDGQKVLIAVKNMGGESKAAWAEFLADLDKRGMKTPEFVIVDGAPGLEAALAGLWNDAPVQRCTVGLLKNLSNADSLTVTGEGIGDDRASGSGSTGVFRLRVAARSGSGRSHPRPCRSSARSGLAGGGSRRMLRAGRRSTRDRAGGGGSADAGRVSAGSRA